MANREATHKRQARHIVLIACCKRKLPRTAPAENLYQGDLFRKSLAYARSLWPDAIFVLSAKHGLVQLDEMIGPYEQTLNRMPVAARGNWASRVMAELEQVSDLHNDRFTFLASHRYREGLIPHIHHAEAPLRGLGIGQQLQWLKRRVLNEEKS